MKYLGIDPGGTTGLALITVNDKRAVLSIIRKSKSETLKDARDLFDEADVIICEDWKTRPKEAQEGAFNYSSMSTPRVIGAVQVLAEGKRFVLQQASIKPVGYGYANMKYVKGKQGMHVEDAIAHVMFFLVSSQLARPL